MASVTNERYQELCILISDCKARSWSKWVGMVAVLTAFPTLVGCHVPQPKGKGVIAHVTEPTSNRNYILYKPQNYVNASEAERRQREWPTVVTFHGMKPFDIAWYQADEWQQEADRYGLIVIAPELHSASVLAEFPLNSPHPEFVGDERATLAIMEHVFKTTGASRRHVLSTGFSSGGYMAHYMMNRHPDKFSALAPRQANFSEEVMSSALAPRSRTRPILIINTQNDFKICREESRNAVSWYQRNGYANTGWIYIKNLGHERTPDLAAAFFAKTAGLRPNQPSRVLASRQAIDGNAAGLDILRGSAAPTPALASAQPTSSIETQRSVPSTSNSSVESASQSQAARNRQYVASRPPRSATTDTQSNTTLARRPVTQPPRNPAPSRSITPQYTATTRSSPQPKPAPAVSVSQTTGTPRLRRNPVSIRLSSAIGIEPLHLAYTAVCPSDWYRSARFEWTLDGQPISNSVNGHQTIATPGEYRLGLRVIQPSGDEYRATRSLRVLPEIRASQMTSQGS